MRKFWTFLLELFFSVDISSSVPCPAGVKYCHYGLGIVVHPRAIIGENTKIYQNVTIGCRNGFDLPTVGSNCEIGGGSTLGNITIGDNVKIGVNAIVVNDIPSNCTVVGIPGCIIKSSNEQKDGNCEDISMRT